MNLFIIAHKVGRLGSSSIVYEKFIKGFMSIGFNVSVLTSEIKSDIVPKSLKVIEERYPLPNKLSKLVTIIFGVSFEHVFWEKKAFNIIKSSDTIKDCDLILVLANRGSEGLINLGMKFAKLVNVPLAVHLVDPVPPPPHWENYEIYRSSLHKGIAKGLKYASLISMNNREMLLYQNSRFEFDILSKSFTVSDPVSDDFTYLGCPERKEIVFVYLGSLYAQRRPENLINGFLKFLQLGYEAKLKIIGNNNLNLDMLGVSGELKENIIIQSWTEDVQDEYLNADVLIDIDIDAENDVFSSGKLKGYLAVDRVILLITRPGSPSSNLLESLSQSVVNSNHHADNIASALEIASQIKYKKSIFDERVPIIHKMKLSTGIENFKNKFYEITGRS